MPVTFWQLWNKVKMKTQKFRKIMMAAFFEPLVAESLQLVAYFCPFRFRISSAK